MRKLTSFAFLKLFLIVTFFVTALALSTANAENVTLDQVIDASLENTSHAQQNYDQKIAEAIDASVIDNPELQVDALNLDGQNGASSSIETSIEITQPLKFSQISGSRYRLRRHLKEVASAEQKYEILKLINEATTLYTQSWLLSERENIFKKYSTDAVNIQKIIKESSAQGQTSPAVALLFSSDAAKLRSDAIAVSAELKQTRTELSKITGRSYQKANFQRPVFSKIPTDSNLLLKFAESQANLRNTINTKLKVAKQRVQVARQDAVLPEIAPRLLYSNSASENDYGIGIMMRIPLWNQNNAERKRANAELHHIQTDLNQISTVPQIDLIDELKESAIALHDRSNNYFKEILPGYRDSYKLTNGLFKQGQIDALELWQVREKLLAAENEALEAVALAVNARGALELEIGGKIEEIK